MRWALFLVLAALSWAARLMGEMALDDPAGSVLLALGLAARIQRELPGVGTTVATLVVAAVVVNQLAGPVLWERAIVAAGESGRTGHKKPATREGGLRS